MYASQVGVDYSLRRQALLRDVRCGLVGTAEVCDASPYLLSASRFLGEATSVRCPICRRENVWHVHYIFGDELAGSAGQARSIAELAILAQQYARFDVYAVEVCRGCGWNHLVRRYLLGKDVTQPDAGDQQDPARETSRVTELAARRRHRTAAARGNLRPGRNGR